MKVTKQRFILLLFVLLLFFIPKQCRALSTGTILYKTSEKGKMFGYDNETNFSLIPGEIYPGGVGIYLGEKNGIPAVAEVDQNGVRTFSAQYFVDLDKGERFVGAKIPKDFNHKDKILVNRFISNIMWQVEGG